MDAKEIKKADGAYASRKFWYSAMTSAGVFATGVLAGLWPAFRPSLETVIGGLIGVLALYSGANVVSKHVLGRNEAALQAAGGSTSEAGASTYEAGSVEIEAAYEEPLPPPVERGSSR